MTQTKTKKALLMSVLSMVLCVAMLVGMTFAWFTDTASTGVNKIQAGNLDVELQMKQGDKWVSAEGETLEFVKAGNAPAGEEVLWEPGCTYKLPELRVVNNGNLALKYKIAISGLTGDSKLAEVIDWYCGEELISKETGMITSEDKVLTAKEEGTPFTIKAHMQENAGNEYQNLSLTGIAITVYATQAASEYDSFNNQYDADAEYKYVDNENDLKAAINDGKNVILNKTIKLSNQLTINKDVTINGNGNALISDKPVSIAADANVTINNVDFTAPTNGRNNASNLYAGGLKGKLVLNGCSFSGSEWDCVQVTPAAGAEIVINNCRFEATKEQQRFIHIQAADNSNADVKVTLTNNFFGSSANLKNSMIDLDYINLASIDFGGNNTYTDTNGDIYVCGSSTARTIESADAYKKLGNKVQKASTSEELANAITSATTPTTVTLKSGTYTLPAIANKTATISGDKNTVLDMTQSAIIGAQNANLDLTLEGVTVKFTNDNYKGITHSKKVTYKDCVINGKQFLYAEEVEFVNCKFVQDAVDYNVWTYGAGKVMFKNCEFNCKGKAVLIYNEGAQSAQKVEFQNCKFTASAQATDKAAIEIDSFGTSYDVIIDQSTAENVTGFANGSNSGNSVWNVKNFVKPVKVTVAGTVVYGN